MPSLQTGGWSCVHSLNTRKAFIHNDIRLWYLLWNIFCGLLCNPVYELFSQRKSSQSSFCIVDTPFRSKTELYFWIIVKTQSRCFCQMKILYVGPSSFHRKQCVAEVTRQFKNFRKILHGLFRKFGLFVDPSNWSSKASFPWRSLAPESFDRIFSPKSDIWMYGKFVNVSHKSCLRQRYMS